MRNTDTSLGRALEETSLSLTRMKKMIWMMLILRLKRQRIVIEVSWQGICKTGDWD